MSQNQEIIESKLCAYIDGELDAEGRTEIEKHLDANPQHRRLLESLKATRDLIKWLPREPAPPELAETLNGQLERSVLLDFDERSLNRNIWPRFLTAAAIVALTGGLAVAVYFTLPKSQKPTPYVSRQGEALSPMPEGSMTEPASDTTRPDDALTASVAMAKAMPPVTQNALADRASDPALDRLATDVSQNQEAIVAAANSPVPAENSARPVSQNAIVMLVHANSTERATRDVTSYLESQNIQWRSAIGNSSTEPAATQPGSQPGTSPQDSLRENMPAMRSGRRAMQGEPTTRPDGPGNSVASFGHLQTDAGATNQLQSNQSQMGLGQLSQSNARGLYVARMSRQQVINLSNSVQQGVSKKSEVKDLPSSVASMNFQSQGQGGLAVAMAPAPMAPAPMAQMQARAGASGAPTTDQSAGALGGGFGPTRPATEPATAPAEPFAATTQPTDAPVDVVIVVQSDAAPTTDQAVAIPQTEPATTPQPQTRPAEH